MRRDTPWCRGTGRPPVPGTVRPGVGRVTRDRGACPECGRRLACSRGRMLPHSWRPKARSRLQVLVEDDPSLKISPKNLLTTTPGPSTIIS